jgi:ubiquinone biosynthesis protein UbiJ
MKIERGITVTESARSLSWYGGDILAQEIARAGREIAAEFERKPGQVKVEIVAVLTEAEE